MPDPWTDRLSEYLDGELSGAERVALEIHLPGCSACAITLDELRLVVQRAQSATAALPDRDLWPGIAARIGLPTTPGARSPRRFTFSLPQLLAAGVALTVLSGAGVWSLTRHRTPPTAAAPVALRRDDGPATTVAVAARSDATYDRAVLDLQQVLAAGRSQLDSSTVRVLEKNLRLIDAAITDAQRALEADAANTYLHTHLARTQQRKLQLLRAAATLVSSQS